MNTREQKIHELIKANYNENTARCVVSLIAPILETIEKEAEERGRQEMKKKAIDSIKEIKELFTKNENKRLLVLPDGITLLDVSRYLQSSEYLGQFQKN